MPPPVAPQLTLPARRGRAQLHRRRRIERGQARPRPAQRNPPVTLEKYASPPLISARLSIARERQLLLLLRAPGVAGAAGWLPCGLAAAG